MNSIEEKELINKISGLVSKANAYEKIEKFFNDDSSRVKKYYIEASNNLIKQGCYSSAIIIIETIENILDKIENLEEEI